MNFRQTLGIITSSEIQYDVECHAPTPAQSAEADEQEHAALDAGESRNC
jgi:hypothetical protein